MPETPKPAWVEALDEAKTALRAAGASPTHEETDSKLRIAYGWMDISKLLKD